MLMVDIPYVKKKPEGRGRGYFYRRVVPPAVREAIGCKNWHHTWRAGTPLAVVEREAMHLAARHDRMIAEAKGDMETAEIARQEEYAREWLTRPPAERHEFLAYLHEQGDGDKGLTKPDRIFVNAMEAGGTYRPESMKLSAALERDRDLYSGDKDERPFKYAVESFIAVIGDKDVTAITRADVSEWLAAQKREGLAPATVKRRYGTIKALVARTLLDLDSDKRNPFDGFKMTGATGGVTDRLPFNKPMLELIETYLTSGRVGFETRALIQIMRGTGTGPAEAGGLVVSDVHLTGAIPFVSIRPNALRNLKTSARDRQVPLVDSAALEAATEAVKRAKKRGKGKSPDDTPLFDGFHPERGADLLSAKTNKALRTAGIPRSRRLTVYSFRHTVKEALRSAGVVDHVQRRVLGHAGEGVADKYGSPRARLAEVAEAMKAALPHLGDIDDSVYSESERVKPIKKPRRRTQ